MSELTEALELFRVRDAKIAQDLVEGAARAYAEGRQIQWCEAHGSRIASATVCDVKDGYPSATIGACSIVPMRLCAERTEET